MATRVVVLGAGFGGLELATEVSGRCGADAQVTLIDRAEGFVFGFSKLDVMFGRRQAEQVLHRYAQMVSPSVRFIGATVTGIDPATRHVETTAGDFDADVLVVALGADLHPEATPGLVEGGHEFYTFAGACRARDALRDFAGGKVVVAVTSTPFKCPPAPSETALLVHEMLEARGLRDRSEISLVMPLGKPIPPSPAASEAVLAAFAERGIEWVPERLVRELDPARKVAVLGAGSGESGGGELPYDLFLGVPVHRVPQVVADSGLAVDGWVPVDPLTLETKFPDVYAVGDVTSIGTPKAGVFAEGQAAAAAARIVAKVKGRTPDTVYDGHGVCYLEFGHDRVAKVGVTFVAGQPPVGDLEGPSAALAADKTAFGANRIRRWFGHEWA
ncbi:NAD(P)/FAD-dependent oxidoreductase [Actinoplanes sp. KI2]|uniref:NAD(P)/FAD-dependent oxidoreductase n=1 Tax=Actinoplanes sp. KI2 TaxID=2983315 RepID=UPI0021D5AEFB|nr:FAD/NAD(P)-binding oxidoreductase [Actinoplanes sp. KI2]MCU7730365.1 NAD(P)/FAD-dependent oxidoreductase [Actinoplanes sp. KI2]